MTSPAANFDRVARLYRWLEYLSFGPWLARCRNARLTHLPLAHRALVLGDGDGRFLASLLSVQPALTADVVDSSRSMLRLLERRVSRMGAPTRQRIHLHHANALDWLPIHHYDLVVTHFFLDCFFPQQLEVLFDRLLPHVRPGARWLVSEFAIPGRGMSAWPARALIALLYRAFGLLTGLPVRALPDHNALLRRRGFVREHQRTYLGGLLCSQVWILPAPVSEGETNPLAK